MAKLFLFIGRIRYFRDDDAARGRKNEGFDQVAEGKMSKSPPAGERPAPALTRTSNIEQDIGNALRAAYDSAVQEEIPPEMLDLLNRLR